MAEPMVRASSVGQMESCTMASGRTTRDMVMACGLLHQASNISVSGRTTIPVAMEFIPCLAMISMRVSGYKAGSMDEALSSSLTVIFTQVHTGMVPLTAVAGMYGALAPCIQVASTMA